MRYTKPWKIEVSDLRSIGLSSRPPHCTKAHAARELGVGRSRVGQLIKSRDLLTITLAGHEYVLTTSLDRLLAEKATQP